MSCFPKNTRCLAASALMLALLLVLALGGCTSNNSEADALVRDADGLRSAAADKFRVSTASVDALLRSAAAGEAIPANQTKATTQSVADDLNSALEDLTQRETKLSQAQQLATGDVYAQYLDLLVQSNDKFQDTINMALAIEQLLASEQYSMAGWDEIKTQEVVSQIYGMQDQIQNMYGESETLRNQAEQLRKDNPEAFE